ncbi:MAG: dihydrofolate reductase family protein [Euryarchaeota archaeon]|nr:dihydrofolate reductase family protein [Euryarchaeota archaeon]
MLPKIIIHNSISLDGSLTNFIPNMELHYQIAGEYKPDVHLIGSNTITAGIELYENGVPPEETTDFEKPKRDKNLPFWVVIDTKGSLKGLLHTCRRFEFCRDVIVLISEKTPEGYKKHLEERNYSYHIVGQNHIDLKQTLALLRDIYQVSTILTDTGRILGNLLLNQGFVDEISLLVHPVLVGKNAYPMFSDIHENITLKLLKNELLSKGYVWLVYKVEMKQ